MTVCRTPLAPAAGLLILLVAACSGEHTVPTARTSTVKAATTSTPAVRIVVNAGKAAGTVSPDVYGANFGTWYDFLRGFVAPSLARSGIRMTRFPGGSESDAYHWEGGGSVCAIRGVPVGYIAPGASFENFVKRITLPFGLDFAVTLDYGSNRACNAGGDPAEAAGWVSRNAQLGGHVRYWTLGNEVYGSYEYDLHPKPHDPYTYARAFRRDFWPAVKAADPSAAFGVLLDAPYDTRWNDTVLRFAAPFDFVEFHYYPEGERTDDQSLLTTDVDIFATQLRQLRSQMTHHGIPPAVPIYLGEFNSSYANRQGKQSVSIVNGLYLGQIVSTAIAAGVPAATWWLAYGGTNCSGHGDFSNKLYGFQTFGSYTLFSDDLTASNPNCPGTPAIPGGTPFPTARVLALYASTVPGGSKVLQTTESPGVAPTLRSYGYAVGAGYVLAVFNNTLQTVTATAAVSGAPRGTYAGTLSVYGTPQYDLSKNNRWVGPAVTSIGSVSAAGFTLDLVPYSVTIVQLK